MTTQNLPSAKTKAFVDTTILTDALLKTSTKGGKLAKAALSRYAETQLPAYALKEFRAGPFGNLIWLYNKLVQERDLGRVYNAINSIRMRGYMLATALQGLESIFDSLRNTTLADLNTRYKQRVTFAEMQADEYRLELRRRLYSMWRKRRTTTTHVVNELPCWPEHGPTEKRGLLETGRRGCPAGVDCSLRKLLIANIDDLKKLRDVANQNKDSEEHRRRYQVLRNLIRKSKDPLSDEGCRRLGDAVFAFFAPPDADVLTTNTKDHGLLLRRWEKVSPLLSGIWCPGNRS